MRRLSFPTFSQIDIIVPNFSVIVNQYDGNNWDKNTRKKYLRSKTFFGKGAVIGLPQIVGNCRDLWDGTQKQSSGYSFFFAKKEANHNDLLLGGAQGGT